MNTKTENKSFESSDLSKSIHLAKKAIQLMDLTNLDPNATNADITNCCERAKQYNVAAICINPQYVALARKLLANTSVKVATVANFPLGNSDIDTVTHDINKAIEDGAEEIDVVMPYEDYIAGQTQAVVAFIKSCKQVCNDKALLKVILETGALPNASVILQASRDAISAGADFIKTSTGKHTQGASLLACVMMLVAIKEAQQENINVGLKISGGVKTFADVSNYFAITKEIIGEQFLTKTSFRIGASSLLDDLLHIIGSHYG